MSTGPLIKHGLLAGVVAALAVTVVASAARGIGVGLEVDGVEIPLGAFVWWILVGTVLGIVLARVLRDRRRFVVVTVAATAASLVPAVLLPDDVATKLTLVAIHLLAAVIIVPPLARQSE